MSTRRFPIPAVAALVLLHGCASRPMQELMGRGPLATGSLYRQAESVVLARDRELAPGCKDRHVTGTVLVRAPDVIANPHGGGESVSFSGTGTPSSYVIPVDRRYSTFVERWSLRRCETNVLYRVTFKPSQDGTLVVAEPEA
jgi:hypothetical protein